MIGAAEHFPRRRFGREREGRDGDRRQDDELTRQDRDWQDRAEAYRCTHGDGRGSATRFMAGPGPTRGTLRGKLRWTRVDPTRP
jgi:hypothetical protein